MLLRKTAKALCDTLGNLIGCKFDPTCVFTDANRGSYIPANSLESRRPLIIMHFRGVREIIIPAGDWDALLKRKISVQGYVNKSVWNYGYYWGYNSLQSGGLHWQTLEDGRTGIHNKKKVRRYLTMLKCRAYEQSKGESPMMIWCSDCYLEKCPMSVIHRKRIEASWDDEVQERVIRKEFYDALNQKLFERFGLEVCALELKKSFDIMPEVIYLVAGFSKQTVKVFISESMFIDMMYYPEKYDIGVMMQEYSMVACVQEYDDEAQDFTLSKVMPITEETELSDLNKFWGKE